MSCDTCHLEGHDEGIFFEKTHPLRIYRSPTVRGTRETPPYFTPASTFSLAETARMVGDRNRYMNPTLTESEVRQLTLFSATVTDLPNPYRGPDGAPPPTVALPGGGTGRPLEGRRLFDGKADCLRCHPPPLFTTDQELSTRGHFIDVGTPRAFPLRTAEQETVFRGVGVPSLVGSWDVFPMLTTGLAGFRAEDGRAGGVGPGAAPGDDRPVRRAAARERLRARRAGEGRPPGVSSSPSEPRAGAEGGPG